MYNIFDKELSMEQFFNRHLHKWPKMKLTGIPVPIVQAKDIISKTDEFIIDMSKTAGGNNRDWNKWANETLHFSKLIELQNIDTWDQYDLSKVHLQDKFNLVKTWFVKNDWMSSNYIFGPNGWCSPIGKIAFNDSIGPNPKVKDIYIDFVLIAKAFPYLQMTATVYEEYDDDSIENVVTFVVKNGNVEMTDEHDAHHYDVDLESNVNMLEEILSNPSSEQGIPNEWVIDFGNKFKPIIDEFFKKD